MAYKQIICIVPHGFGEEVISTSKNAGANGGTIIMGKGTANNSVLQLLGLGDTSKDIVYVISESEKSKAILAAIKNCVPEKQKHFGVMFSLYTKGFIKAGSNLLSKDSKGEQNMNQTEYEMINVIVNKGYAEDAMAAARKVGAGGGTIISARGTAKEGDAKFFGMEIVPEKDMLMILIPKDKKEEVVKSISQLNCFSKAGTGIIFTNPVQDFTLLGK